MTAEVRTSEPVLSVRDLAVDLMVDGRWTAIVKDVSFDLFPNETLGLVGESGSGKTVTSMAIMGLLGRSSVRTRGQVRLEQTDLLSMSERELTAVRGRDIAMVFQDSTRSLNPAFTVGDQVAEVVRRHMSLHRSEAWERAIELLELVGIPQARRRAKDYPHQFSGGMCQRVMLASAMACEPKVLIADEPTTALDVTVQAQVLDLMRELQERVGIAILLITHDLAVVAEMCQRVAVMYAGELVEQAAAEPLFVRPRHPYTAGLLASIPSPTAEAAAFGFIPGVVPRPGQEVRGCLFHDRCADFVAGRCDEVHPALEPPEGDHRARCLRSDELDLRGIDAPRVA
ncbi:MAG TPA: ABC transporter ATP-binding protein [Acidimicrobiales bacterium]|nr:ABC transporter ATP-binding protein [Acidimicrobiales bacterium]